MSLVPVILSVWGLSILLLIGVTIYGSRLARNEEDQLFLADSSSHARSEQDAIAAKVQGIQPLKRATLVIVGLTTLGVLVYFIQDVIKQF